MDYCIFRREVLPRSGDLYGGDPPHVFLSAYNQGERLAAVFGRVQARKKAWMVHEEYAFVDADLPDDMSSDLASPVKARSYAPSCRKWDGMKASRSSSISPA